MTSSFPCTCYTKERPTIATRSSASLVSWCLSCPTRQIKKHARFTKSILKPHITGIREEMDSPDQPAVLIMDKFRGQINAQVQENLPDNRILVVNVPAGTTDKLQPLDHSVNKVAEDFHLRVLMPVVQPTSHETASGSWGPQDCSSQHE